MNHSESIAGIIPALIKTQGELQGIAKEGKNPAFKSRYVTLDSILDALRPVLARHGLVLFQSSIENQEPGLCVESKIMHTSGEWVSNSLTIPVMQQTAHGIGSALTYGRRYTISALLAISADEDEDGNAAVGKQPQASPQNAQPAPLPPRPLKRPYTQEVDPFLKDYEK